MFNAVPKGSMDSSKALDQERFAMLLANHGQDPHFNQIELRKLALHKMGVDDIDMLLIDPAAIREIPQGIENTMLLQGMQVEVKPTDNHEEHIQTMLAQEQARFGADGSVENRLDDPFVRQGWEEHKAQHMAHWQQAMNPQQQQPGGQQGPAPSQFDGQNGTSENGVNGRLLARSTPGGGMGAAPGPGGNQRGGGVNV